MCWGGGKWANHKCEHRNIRRAGFKVNVVHPPARINQPSQGSQKAVGYGNPTYVIINIQRTYSPLLPLSVVSNLHSLFMDPSNAHQKNPPQCALSLPDDSQDDPTRLLRGALLPTPRNLSNPTFSCPTHTIDLGDAPSPNACRQGSMRHTKHSHRLPTLTISGAEDT